mmetsp:Transcript_24475/g.64356  ORF Transcript_24475/g.64356 Transcript_24475/m.64356 type:complete len:85 (-) Transcript_24475:104-358(-)
MNSAESGIFTLAACSVKLNDEVLVQSLAQCELRHCNVVQLRGTCGETSVPLTSVAALLSYLFSQKAVDLFDSEFVIYSLNLTCF